LRAPRFSIGSLLTVIAILGVGFAALRSPSPVWASAIFTVTAVTLVAAASNAIFGRGARRAYWLGFALFGGAYFYLTMSSNQLVTETMLDLLYAHVGPQVPQPPPAPPVLPLPIATPVSPPPIDPTATSVSYELNSTQYITSGTITASSYPASLPTVSAWEHWTKPDRRIGEYVFPTEFTARFSSLSFRQIGHSLAALLAATLGGVFARWRYEGNSKAIELPGVSPGSDQPDAKVD
jgi:hypothetical protein